LATRLHLKELDRQALRLRGSPACPPDRRVARHGMAAAFGTLVATLGRLAASYRKVGLPARAEV
jgi:hypothetical protein